LIAVLVFDNFLFSTQFLMPKTKRNKQISLTKTQKKGSEHKSNLIEKVHALLSKHTHLYVF